MSYIKKLGFTALFLFLLTLVIFSTSSPRAIARGSRVTPTPPPHKYKVGEWDVLKSGLAGYGNFTIAVRFTKDKHIQAKVDFPQGLSDKVCRIVLGIRDDNHPKGRSIVIDSIDHNKQYDGSDHGYTENSKTDFSDYQHAYIRVYTKFAGQINNPVRFGDWFHRVSCDPSPDNFFDINSEPIYYPLFDVPPGIF